MIAEGGEGSGSTGTQRTLKERLAEPGSVFAEWIERTFENYIDFRFWWRQRKLILADPRVAMGGDERLRKTPLQFSVQATVFVAVLTSLWGFGLRLLSASKSEAASRVEEIRALDRRWKEFEERTGSSATGLSLTVTQARELEDLREETRDWLREHVEELDERRASHELVEQFSTSLAILASAAIFRWRLRKYRAAYPRVALADRASLFFLGAALFLPQVLLSLSATSLSSAGNLSEGGRLLVAGVIALCGLIGGIPAGAAWYFFVLRRSAWTLSHLFGFPAARGPESSFSGPGVVFRALVWSMIAALLSVAVVLSILERVLLWLA